MEPVLYTQYKAKIVPALMSELGCGNVMEVPRVEKVVLNVGYGRHVKDKGFVDNIDNTLKLITGQKPVHNKSRKSISNFKLRAGMEIGASITLRGAFMYEFLYKLVNITLPRVRDFRGLSPKSFDGKGNYTVGFKEHLPFPEISGDAANVVHGLEVTIVTNAKKDARALALLKQLGFPFKEK